MKKYLFILGISSFIISCNNCEKEHVSESKSDSETTEPKTNNEKPTTAVNDTTPRVTGIGGIFFKSKNGKDLNKWYETNLGLVMSEYGSTFEFRNANRPDEINYLQWGIFNEKTDYFDPSKKQFMINYRVQNLEGLIRNFRKAGITIVDSIQVVEYGKFVHIMDPEGNKIELWEPIDEVLTEYGEKTDAKTTK